MTHGDDNGLVLPPAIAPIQAVLIPIATHKEGVLDKANEVYARMSKICRAKDRFGRAVARLEICRIRNEGRSAARGTRT